MRATTVSKFATILVVIITGCFAAYLSGYAAMAGAQLGGLKEGGWNWQFLAPLAAGWLFGTAITVIVAIVLLIKCKTPWLPLLGTLISAPALIFLGSAVVYAVRLYPQREIHAEIIRLGAKAQSDPQYRHDLVTKARNGPLSLAEESALVQAIYRRLSFPDDDIPFLIRHFSKDVAIVDPLLRYDSLTAEDLRETYEAHKLDPGHSRISEVLVDTGRAPMDILEDIAEHNSRYPKSHQYSKPLIQKAREEMERKQPKSPAE